MSELYKPCRNGIHVCGISGDEEEFVTVGNRPGATRETFEQLRDEHALPEGVGTPEQQNFVEYALLVRPLPARLRGVAPTISGLNGLWASPGLGYGARVALLAETMRRAR